MPNPYRARPPRWKRASASARRPQDNSIQNPKNVPRAWLAASAGHPSGHMRATETSATHPPATAMPCSNMRFGARLSAFRTASPAATQATRMQNCEKPAAVSTQNGAHATGGALICHTSASGRYTSGHPPFSHWTISMPANAAPMYSNGSQHRSRAMRRRASANVSSRCTEGNRTISSATARASQRKGRNRSVRECPNPAKG